MPTQYEAEVDESQKDRDLLSTNNYSLQFAKSVATSGGQALFNVVYQSSILAPHMNIQWTVTYGLNWTTKMPSPGAKVNYTGNWQQCDLGASYKLDNDGDWVAMQNNKNAKADSLNVGSNDYPVPVYILVGVQDPTTKDWSPIWIGPDQLLKSAHGEYQPLEEINIWFQEGDRAATMIYNQATPIQDYTMTVNPFYFSYDAVAGKWRTPQDHPFDFKKKPEK